MGKLATCYDKELARKVSARLSGYVLDPTNTLKIQMKNVFEDVIRNYCEAKDRKVETYGQTS